MGVEDGGESGFLRQNEEKQCLATRYQRMIDLGIGCVGRDNGHTYIVCAVWLLFV